MLFAQRLKLGCAGILPLSHDEHALLSARAIGKGEVISRREDPLVSRVQKERKILRVIVAVMSENVEAGQRIYLFCFPDISGQGQGHTQNHVVVEAGSAMIGMDQAAQAMHVDAGISIPVEAFGAEV